MMNAGSARLATMFANLGHFFNHGLMLLYPTVVLGLGSVFPMTYGELLALSTPGFVLYGLAALPAGWLGDRWSAEHMMVLFFVGCGAGAIVTGLATSPLWILLGLSMIGLFGSIYHPVGMAWLVRNSTNRGKTLGWNGIFGSVGMGSASFVAAALTSLWSWRAAFIVPGAICALLGVALFLCVRSRTVVAGKVDLKPQVEASRADVIRAFIVLSVTMLGTGLVAQIEIVSMPKIFEQRLGDLTAGTMLGTGGFVSLVFLISSFAQIVGGWLADRYSLKMVYALTWAAQVPVFVLAMRFGGLPLFACMASALCLNIFGGPTENSLLARYTPGKWRATAFGAKFVLAFGVSALGVPLVGMVYDRTGDFLWLFAILACVAAMVAVAATFLPRAESESLGKAAAVPAE